MKNLFSLDNPFIQMLGRAGDFIILNLLFLIFSLPLFTMGASLVALHAVCTDIAEEKDSGIILSFIAAFKSNFKQSTIVFFSLIFICAGLFSYLLIGLTYFEHGLLNVLRIVLTIVLILVLSIWVYLIDLIARYDNGLKEHISNAGILAVIKLPKTILLLALLLLPIIIAFISIQVFIYTLIFWLMFGFSFTRYLSCLLFISIHKELELDSGPAPTLFK